MDCKNIKKENNTYVMTLLFICNSKLSSNLKNFALVCLLLTFNKLVTPGKRSMSFQYGI